MQQMTRHYYGFSKGIITHYQLYELQCQQLTLLIGTFLCDVTRSFPIDRSC
jgi:hypothetical protein